MKKIRYTSSLYLLFAFTTITMGACSEQTEDNISSGTKTISLNNQAGLSTSMKTNCYVFRDNILNQIVRDLSSSFNMSVPENASLYFFAGFEEPTELANVKKGMTTLDNFLNIRTDENTQSEFYTAAITGIGSSDNIDIKLRIGEAQINLDATSSDLLQISKVTAENVPTSTFVFEKEHLISPTTKQSKVYEPSPPVSGSKKNILRLYESEIPVKFTIEGSYDGIPLNFEVSLPKVMRNHEYTLQVVNAGAEISAMFEVKPWAETDTINTAPATDKKIVINQSHSAFPDGTEFGTSNESAIIPYTGGDITLAFLSTTPVDFESVVDEENYLDFDQKGVISRESGKILTTFHIKVKQQEENTIPYTIILKPKSVLRKYSSNQISLIVNSPPLYIREVTLGGLTWMAFNVQSKEEVIYPIKKNDVEAMYNNEWITSLGGMFQYGRQYKYAPWESGVNNQGNQAETDSWTDASSTPCPKGYRLPTYNEAIDFFGVDTGGGGVVPGTWKTGDEDITATIETATNSQININGVTGTAKYLKLSGSKGGVMYIPFGGMKSNANPSDKNPKFTQGFRLWLSEEGESSKAWSIYCGNLSGYEVDDWKNIAIIEADKESYAYARCVKIE